MSLAEKFDFKVSSPIAPIPNDACDCHVHILGPADRYAYDPLRSYTPMDALPEDALPVFNQLGIERLVVVQPSVYGVDNTRLLQAMYELPIESRGIAVVDPLFDHKKLQQFHDIGVRGIRFHGIHWSAEELKQQVSNVERIIENIVEMNWHMEFFIGSQTYPALDEIAEKYQIQIVLDHFGGMFSLQETITDRIAAYEYFQSIGNIWVTLSGQYRIHASKSYNEWSNKLLDSLIKMMPDRLIWASDWPHTPQHQNSNSKKSVPKPFQNIDGGFLLSNFIESAADPLIVRRILVDNPRSLYQF